jgi:hypothetical protein
MKEERKESTILSELKVVDGKYILPLSKEIKHGQRTVTELSLSEPKAKHIRKMPTNPIMDDVLKACGALAGEPDSLIDELTLKDCNKLAEFFGAFN